MGVDASRSLRVLMIEDSDDDAALIQRELRRGGVRFEARRVFARDDLHAALDDAPYDLVLTDYSMPSFTGIDALGIVRARFPDMPCLMISGTIGEDAAVEALRAGADDFLVKGRWARLMPAVERALRDAADRAHRRNAEQAAEDARRRQLVAEAQSRTKSEFVANVCHELRTPLNAILGFTQLLQEGVDGPLTPRQHEHVRNALEGGHHLLSVINDLLDVSKIEAGRMTLSFEPTSVADIVARTRTALQPLLARRQHTLEVDVPDDLPVLWADPLRMRQILFNLLSNACKFSPLGSPIRVTGRVEGDDVLLEVHDSGIGLEPDQVARLFRPYEQFVRGDGEGLGGTGLGLALCRQLIELQKGTVEVESEPGKGSTFRLRMPKPAVPLEVRPRPETPAVSRPAPPIRSARILVVEDDALSMMLAKILLERRGHMVVSATSLDEARARLAEAAPELVLTDMHLADGGGEELLAEIRANRSLRHLPVMAVTADAMHGVREHLLSLGFDGYLTKPVDATSFAPSIESLLAARA